MVDITLRDNRGQQLTFSGTSKDDEVWVSATDSEEEEQVFYSFSREDIKALISHLLAMTVSP